ncbi:uncharacterized protein BDZ99DRAFT_474425 [Mytilinidion resinicola]|uniref:Uncharacterized protein n=1 Tax=Mytilinidion resinicola TaxID=574789 RepID=A0A6A6YW52_9PEZI|nr:uncharacterized protein BDZ99DRAFT_474425 [Mytilinidion resinicola]KAF2812215.1 hypothetical protein BDZ99DRAFT_474425 [Mytilinidion resinicola]
MPTHHFDQPVTFRILLWQALNLLRQCMQALRSWLALQRSSTHLRAFDHQDLKLRRLCNFSFLHEPRIIDQRALNLLRLQTEASDTPPTFARLAISTSPAEIRDQQRRMDYLSESTEAGPSAAAPAPRALRSNWCRDVDVHRKDSAKLEGATFIPLDQISIISVHEPNAPPAQAIATTRLTIYNTGSLHQRNFGHGIIVDKRGEIIGCWRKEQLASPEPKGKWRADPTQYQPREVALHNALQNPYGFSIRVDILASNGPTYNGPQAREARSQRLLRPRASGSGAALPSSWQNDPITQAVLQHVNVATQTRADKLREMFDMEPPLPLLLPAHSNTSSPLSSPPASDAEEDALDTDDEQPEWVLMSELLPTLKEGDVWSRAQMTMIARHRAGLKDDKAITFPHIDDVDFTQAYWRRAVNMWYTQNLRRLGSSRRKPHELWQEDEKAWVRAHINALVRQKVADGGRLDTAFKRLGWEGVAVAFAAQFPDRTVRTAAGLLGMFTRRRYAEEIRAEMEEEEVEKGASKSAKGE